MKEKFDITGMTCSACSTRVERCVSGISGVNGVSVNLLTNQMQAEYDESVVSPQDIIGAVTEAGYGATSHTGEQKKEQSKDNDATIIHIKNMKNRIIISICFMIPLMYVAMGHMWNLPLPGFLLGHENAVSFGLIQFLLCLPIIYVNRAYYEKGFRTLFKASPNMDSLIAVGSFAALAYGVFAIFRMSYGLGNGNMELVSRYHMDLYFESAAMILTLITLGKYLEARSKGKTSEAITKLMDMAPQTAIVEREGIEIEVPATQVMAGEIVIVKPGQSIAVDGTVVEGTSSVDESAITGESIPVLKEVGMNVTSATINQSGFMRIRAIRVGEDTTFSQIIRLVEEASSSKAPIAKMADRIAGIFVPIVMLIALVTGIVWMVTGAGFEFALSCAVCVLVISCPCALGLATPVAIMVGTGKGAENGILIKSGDALETAHSINTVVLDKTGTITEGKPVVTDVFTEGIEEVSFLGIAAGMEQKSEHPLASAVMSYAEEQGTKLAQTEAFTSVPGKGIRAKIEQKALLLGNERWLIEQNITLSDHLQEQLDQWTRQGKTPLVLAEEKGNALGAIAVADTIKPTSPLAIRSLRKMGVNVIMLTGDNEKTARGIAQQLELNDIISEVLPSEKEREISKLQEKGLTVAMVGDGINDAPALSRADVGIAIGAGTDIAVESADVILMKSDLLDVVNTIRLSKSVMRNIKQNLFWAFFYNCLGIPLAAGVFYHALGWKLSPMFGAAAMSLSSIFVVTNALRLKRFKNAAAENRAAQSSVKLNLLRPRSTFLYNKNELLIENQKEEIKMTVKINGMMCMHCVGHVQKALDAIEGVQAKVVLEDKAAYLTLTKEVSDEQIIEAVKEAGYEVTSIE